MPILQNRAKAGRAAGAGIGGRQGGEQQAFLRMSTFSQVSSWKIFLLIYKQVRKLLPDPEGTVRKQCARIRETSVDHRPRITVWVGILGSVTSGKWLK